MTSLDYLIISPTPYNGIRFPNHGFENVMVRMDTVAAKMNRIYTHSCNWQLKRCTTSSNEMSKNSVWTSTTGFKLMGKCDAWRVNERVCFFYNANIENTNDFMNLRNCEKRLCVTCSLSVYIRLRQLISSASCMYKVDSTCVRLHERKGAGERERMGREIHVTG